ncbi:MAG: hypothetical protein DSY46_01155 [Hydrogenimonas sp.]|nr:MAG: hypothetical protein DSY46_01155 [Hydrogenimonas sp.]
MIKPWIPIAICTIFVTTSLHAYSAKGMVAYKKVCKQCHGSGFKGASMLESDEWEEMFEKRAEKLKRVHADDPDATRVLNSNYFKRHYQSLGNFLRNNGRDMGVVRSCDGLNCG